MNEPIRLLTKGSAVTNTHVCREYREGGKREGRRDGWKEALRREEGRGEGGREEEREGVL